MWFALSLWRLCLDHGELGSNADVADGGVRKVRARTRFAQQSVPGHSLRYDLSAPPPASQVFATGVASSRQTKLSRCNRTRKPPSGKTNTVLFETGCRMNRSFSCRALFPGGTARRGRRGEQTRANKVR